MVVWSQTEANKLSVRYFPIVLLIYAVGIVAVEYGKWEFLRKALVGEKTKILLSAIFVSDYISNVAVEEIQEHYARGGAESIINEVIYSVVKDLLADYFVNEERFKHAFVAFEFLLSVDRNAYGNSRIACGLGD